MNRDNALGLVLILLLLGGILLVARRPAAPANYTSAPLQKYNQGNIKFIPAQEESRRYQNKEIREVEFEHNDDGSLQKLKMVITRDYAIT